MTGGCRCQHRTLRACALRSFLRHGGRYVRRLPSTCGQQLHILLQWCDWCWREMQYRGSSRLRVRCGLPLPST